jgi:hypothetical protein
MDNRPFSDWCCPECGAFLSRRAILQSEAEPLLDAHYEAERQSQIMVNFRERGAPRLPEDLPTRRALYLGTVAGRVTRAREHEPSRRLAVASSGSRHRLSAPLPPATAPLMGRPSPVVPMPVRPSKTVAVAPPRKLSTSPRERPVRDLPLDHACRLSARSSEARLPGAPRSRGAPSFPAVASW